MSGDDVVAVNVDCSFDSVGIVSIFVVTVWVVSGRDLTVDVCGICSLVGGAAELKNEEVAVELDDRVADEEVDWYRAV